MAHITRKKRPRRQAKVSLRITKEGKEISTVSVRPGDRVQLSLGCTAELQSPGKIERTHFIEVEVLP